MTRLRAGTEAATLLDPSLDKFTDTAVGLARVYAVEQLTHGIALVAIGGCSSATQALHLYIREASSASAANVGNSSGSDNTVRTAEEHSDVAVGDVEPAPEDNTQAILVPLLGTEEFDPGEVVAIRSCCSDTGACAVVVSKANTTYKVYIPIRLKFTQHKLD